MNAFLRDAQTQPATTHLRTHALEKIGDVLDALSSGIAKFAANEPEAVGDGPQYSKIVGEGVIPVQRLWGL